MGGGGGKGGGGASSTSTINVNNSGTTNVDSDSTVEIRGLDNIKTAIDLKLPQPFKTETVTELKLPQPFKTESRQELAITQPIVSDSKSAMALDIRPMTVDLCVNISLGPIPPTCIRQPYHTHFGFTLYGQEVFGFNFSGESQVIVQDLPKQPQVAWGGEEMAERSRNTVVVGQPATEQKEGRSGLRIRVGT
jgi:hypothetical protein